MMDAMHSDTYYSNVETKTFNDIASMSYVTNFNDTMLLQTVASVVIVNSSSDILSSAIPNFNRTTSTASSTSVFESKLIIPLYVVIFLLSVVGNSLVLITLAQNKRMRTVTNVYLLNLAVSDLLLGVFCMPFTLVGQVLRNFIFGALMCKLIPYFQAVSVSVGVWTLVAISLERYFAICRPLKSRRWQTQFHAYKMITVVWLASLLWNVPILAVSTLKAMRGRGHKCREEWPSAVSEQAYNLFLDAMLLLVPLIIMSLAYSLIMTKLWKGLRREIKHNSNCQRQMQRSCSTMTMNGVAASLINNNSTSCGSVNNLTVPSSQGRRLHQSVKSNRNLQLPVLPRKCKVEKSDKRTDTVKLWLIKGMVQVRLPNTKSSRTHFKTSGKATTTLVNNANYEMAEHSPTSNEQCAEDSSSGEANSNTNTYTFTRHAIRSNYMEKSIEAKRKVIRMLFVVVAEFFVCWAPLHVLNTWYLFSPELVYQYVGSTGVSLVQLLAYISSCCNPITYCFMNRKFRQAFLGVFNCYSLCCCCCCKEKLSNKRASLHSDGVHLGTVQNNSDISGNDSTVYVGRASTLGRSEVMVLEAEEHV